MKAKLKIKKGVLEDCTLEPKADGVELRYTNGMLLGTLLLEGEGKINEVLQVLRDVRAKMRAKGKVSGKSKGKVSGK